MKPIVRQIKNLSNSPIEKKLMLIAALLSIFIIAEADTVSKLNKTTNWLKVIGGALATFGAIVCAIRFIIKLFADNPRNAWPWLFYAVACVSVWYLIPDLADEVGSIWK